MTSKKNGRTERREFGQSAYVSVFREGFRRLFFSTITVARWKLNAFGVVCVGIGMLLGVYFGISTLLISRAATSPWTQTDWSGGVGASTTNQYSAGTNVDATTTAGQVTLTATANWYNSDWKYRKKITFDNRTSALGTTSEALTDFPVLVKLDSGPDIDYTKTKDAGEDIRFTDSNGATLIPYEIEKWDETGTSYVWVKVPQIDIDSNADFIYLYYGNTGANDAQSASSVWDGSFLGVWHANDSSSTTLVDSTSNAKNATKQSSNQPNYTAAGQIAGAQTYTQALSRAATSIVTALTNFTVEVWFKDNGVATGYERLADKGYANCFWLGRNSGSASSWGGGVRETADPYGVFVTLTDGSWHQIASIRSGTTHYVYGDGGSVSNSNTVSGTACDGTTFSIGAWGDGSSTGQWFGGIIDEVRLSSVARTKAWVAASYKSGTDAYAAFEAEEPHYATSGTLTSNIFDTEFSSDWGSLTYSADTTGGTVAVRVRAGNQADLSDATAFGSCSDVASGSDLSGGCTADQRRYVQYQIALASTAAGTPILQDVSIAFVPSDITAPSNPTAATALNQSGGTVTLTSGIWYNYSGPTFTLSGAADAAGPEGVSSGVQGYFVYFGIDPTANPATAGTFQASVTYTAGSLVSGTTYYLRVKTRDVAQNVSGTAITLFTYKYDATQPVNPAYVAANPAGYSSANSFSFIWPTGSDTLSGISGYYYKTGATSGAYSTEQLTTATLLNDVPAYQNGENVFYLRSADTAGNLNVGYAQVTYYYNANAPSASRNLTVAPSSNTKNSFAFSWDEPATYKGRIAGYRYSINAKPTATNTTSTTGRSLPAGPYATQVGENTFYVVAQDDSGNINYDVYASTTFTAQTSSPGVPLNVKVFDTSDRSTLSYSLTVKWDAPIPLPEDFSGYIVERAEMASAAAASVRAFEDLTYARIATVQDTAYTNTGLDSAKTYSYRVKTSDTTSNVSAASSAVSKVPTGKFTEPPAITKGPTVEARSTSAVVAWTTDRAGTSLAQYGLTTAYGGTAGSLTSATEHELALSGLAPSTTYHLRVQTVDAPELIDYSTSDTGFSTDIVFKTLDAPGLTDITVSDITLTSAIVSWKSNVVSTSKVLYGTSTGYGSDITDASSSQVTNHTVRLTKLIHSTSYHFRIDSKDAEGNSLRSDDYVFDTLKLPVASNIKFQPVKGKPTATVDVSWKTNVPTTSVVSYRPETETAPLEQSKAALETDHTVQVTNLLDDTSYVLSITGRDGFGNAVTADAQRFKTDTDSRAPQIADIVIETQIQGRGDEARAQLVVSWNSDEPTTAQVEYGAGLSGEDYPNKTAEEAAYSNSHVVVVSELDPAKTYHLRVKSKDRAGNETLSGDQVVITGRANASILNLILTNLQRTFGWLGGLKQ